MSKGNVGSIKNSKIQLCLSDSATSTTQSFKKRKKERATGRDGKKYKEEVTKRVCEREMKKDRDKE